MGLIDGFISKVFSDFENSIDATDEQAFEIEFQSNSQVELASQGVVFGDKGLRGGPARDGLLADFTGDGLPDLFVARPNGGQLFRNLGHGEFAKDDLGGVASGRCRGSSGSGARRGAIHGTRARRADIRAAYLGSTTTWTVR